jgi:hypothetical protein
MERALIIAMGLDVKDRGENDSNVQGRVFLWCGKAGSDRFTEGDGKLPLQFMPLMVRWSGQRLQPLGS